MSVELCELLINEYRTIGTTPPKWAYPAQASIPFVGRNYGRWGGILIYASAENLAHYEREPQTVPAYLTDDRSINRHRVAYDLDKSQTFFPFVHMAPFNNGSLLVALHYLIEKRFGEQIGDPRELLESVAAANLCKFSISVGSKGKNQDYAGQQARVAASIPFFRADLRCLQPAIIVLPQSMLKHEVVSEAISSVCPRAEVVGVYQFNAGIVNRQLKKHDVKAKKLAATLQDTVIATWIEQLNGYAPGYPYRYLVELDEILNVGAN